MPRRVCATPGCPKLIPAGTRRCPTHTRDHERARGTSTTRGYDTTHQRERRHTATLIAQAHAAGHPILCTRCRQPITPTDAWDLDHADDRRHYLGPAHASCNRRAGGLRSHMS